MRKRGPTSKLEREVKKASKADKNIVVSSYLPAPTYLTPLAKKYWEKTVSAFPMGHFNDGDRVLLEQFCESAALHRNATRTLTKEGRKYTDAKGVMRKNPAVDDQHQARCDCAMLATKLRITKTSMISPKAAGRAAQKAADEAEANAEFGDLLYGGEEVRQ